MVISGTAHAAPPRIGEIYHRELTASNANATVWQSVLTKSINPNPDFEQTNRFWFAKASVTPTYDVDGNLTDDGRWVYPWEAEIRLVQMTITTVGTNSPTLHPYTTIKFVTDATTQLESHFMLSDFRGSTTSKPYDVWRKHIWHS